MNINNFDCPFNNYNNKISSGNSVGTEKKNCWKYFAALRSMKYSICWNWYERLAFWNIKDSTEKKYFHTERTQLRQLSALNYPAFKESAKLSVWPTCLLAYWRANVLACPHAWYAYLLACLACLYIYTLYSDSKK